MPRCNGSYIGIDASPNANVASGIWTVREAETLLRANKWPATPTVPSAPTGTAGNAQVALTWTAPTGGSASTDYIVQYSSNAGSTWTTFSDGVSAATSATVTGLTNGTGYIFRIQAVNSLGEGPVGSASGTITPIAPTLLLHFDGTNGSTTFTDSSPSARTVTANGDAAISTAESKFGGASGLFDGGAGSIDYLSVAASAELQPLGGDFTIEFWWYPLSSNRQGLFSSATDHWLGVDYMDGYIGMWAGSGPGWDLIESDTSQGRGVTEITLNQWHHIAYTRTGNDWRLFLDGVLEKKVTVSGSVVDRAAEDMVIGAWAGGSDFPVDGYMDEFRYIVGHSAYNSDATFTPPTSPF